MTPVGLVLFDLDETLCDYDRAGRIADLARLCGRPADAIRAAIWDSGFEDDSDRGALAADAYLAGFGQRLGIALTREAWLANRRAHTSPRPAMLSLVRRVQERAATAVFTQNGHLLRESFRAIFPDIVEVFGAGNIHLCCEVGALKNESQAYLRLLEVRRQSPESTLFVDDVAGYVEVAERAGLQAHHFTGIAGLERRLRDLSLIA